MDKYARIQPYVHSSVKTPVPATWGEVSSSNLYVYTSTLTSEAVKVLGASAFDFLAKEVASAAVSARILFARVISCDINTNIMCI